MEGKIQSQHQYVDIRTYRTYFWGLWEISTNISTNTFMHILVNVGLYRINNFSKISFWLHFCPHSTSQKDNKTERVKVDLFLSETARHYQKLSFEKSDEILPTFLPTLSDKNGLTLPESTWRQEILFFRRKYDIYCYCKYLQRFWI